MSAPLAGSAQATVAIVLCTFNGESHIAEQIESLLSQTWPVAIRVFDDASTDGTVDILKRYSTGESFKLFANTQNAGYVGNFEAGIRQVMSEHFQYIALCDQDDIWAIDRIETGMRAIHQAEESNNDDTPLLSHSDLCMIDADGGMVQPSFFAYRGYDISAERSVATILGQNGVMGNTVLMNRQLATLSLPFPQGLHVHDYWLALLCELFGQRLLVPRTPVQYRIHASNASNSADNTRFGLQKFMQDKSLQGFLARDFRLPFREDSRSVAIDELLNNPQRFPEIKTADSVPMQMFNRYLHMKKPRIGLLFTMIKAGFFRRPVRHRIRVCFSFLTSKRYH